MAPPETDQYPLLSIPPHGRSALSASMSPLLHSTDSIAFGASEAIESTYGTAVNLDVTGVRAID
jgi:hypothetical protein